MTGRRRLALLTVLGLVVLGIGTTYNAITMGPSRAPGDLPSQFGTTSVDLVTGTGGATLSAANMAPGDVVRAAITVTNSGREALAYAMDLDVSDGGGELASALMLTIRTVGSSCAEADGTILFDGPLREAAIASDADGRPLAGASADILCFQAWLPIDSGDALARAATTITLRFRAGVDAAAAVR